MRGNGIGSGESVIAAVGRFATTINESLFVIIGKGERVLDNSHKDMVTGINESILVVNGTGELRW